MTLKLEVYFTKGLKNRLWNLIFPSQKSYQDLCWWFSILGCIEVMIMHPLDLIKTRFQLQNNNMQGQQQYLGVRDCARKMYQQEGLFSFWKGLLPPILVETPKRAWKFFTFEQFQKIFLFGREKPGALVGKYSFFKKNFLHTFYTDAINCTLNNNVVISILQTYSLAGLGSGVTEAIIVNPFEVVKVKMQSNRSHQSQTPSTW